MTDVKLGTVPAEGALRDAIHIAVVPVTASCDFNPGAHVQVVEGTAYHSKDNCVGVVDPFRRQPVKKGERFWLLLYQNTIVGMRHHWSHPSFSDLPPTESRAPASEAWLRNFAREYYYDDYHGMMENARGGSLCFGDDDYPNHASAEFWAHYNALTGSTIDGFFHCAC